MPAKTKKSTQVAVRFKNDTHSLLQKDSRKVRGISTVVNKIVEKHYEKPLAKIRERAQKKQRNEKIKTLKDSL